MIREIQEFSQSSILYPHLSEINNLNGFLESVNLSGKSGHFRNIMVKVEFKEYDSPTSSGLKAYLWKNKLWNF